MSTPVLTTEPGRDGWESIVADPATALVVTDFDGTLSPLVDDPAASRPVDGALDALARLSASVRQVALLTGRPALVVTELSGVNGYPGLDRLLVLGLYGLERFDASPGTVSREDVPAGVAAVRDRLPGVLAAAGWSDAHVEDK